MPIFRLTHDLVFPPPRLAEDGLLAVGGDLSEKRLLLAYRMGIFPWYSEDEPILWWSPDPRLILAPQEFHMPRRLQRTLRQGTFAVTMDTAFERVIKGCAATPRRGQRGTWIMPEMVSAYCRLHESGYGHSVECWRDGQLTGGLYGLSLGRCFFGESMFSLEPDASKVALAALVERVTAWGFLFIDCQVTTEHLVRLGAKEVSRMHFLRLLGEGLKSKTRRGKWSIAPGSGM